MGRVHIDLLRLSATVLAALWIPMVIGAPDKTADVPIEVGFSTSIWSEALAEMRPLQIHVPRSHDKRRAACPVLYVLDGADNFLHTVAAVEFLAEAGRMPDTIVVAIPNIDRGRDLTPNIPGCKADCGRGDRFLDFLTRELAPWVESRYHTAPFRILTGHSRGGLFTFHTLLNTPEAFNAYIPVSPALWWNDEAVLKDAEEKLRKLPPRRFLYTSDGDEAESLTRVVAKMVAILKRTAPANLNWHYAHLRNEEHMTTRHRTIYDGLEEIFAGMQVPRDVIRTQGIKGIETHYAGLAAHYGFNIRPPMGMLDWCGYFLLQQGKPDMAVEVFQRNVELYPTEPGVYSGLSGALNAAGRLKEARTAIEQAYRLAAPW